MLALGFGIWDAAGFLLECRERKGKQDGTWNEKKGLVYGLRVGKFHQNGISGIWYMLLYQKSAATTLVVFQVSLQNGLC